MVSPVNWCIFTSISKDSHTFPFRVKHSPLLGFLTLKKRYEHSERRLLYQLTWLNTPEDLNFQEPLCHNIKLSTEFYFLHLLACIILYIDRQIYYWD